MSSIEIVEGFFRRWAVSYDEFCASFTDTFAEDGIWQAAPGVPDAVGAEQAIALLEAFKDGHGMATVQVDMTRIGQAGDAVWTERVDHMLDAQGVELLAIPVAGVLTLDADGKITTYRDYWNMMEFNALAAS